jgi:hypothetical protein
VRREYADSVVIYRFDAIFRGASAAKPVHALEEGRKRGLRLLVVEDE